jgi:hypothetical protein
MAHPNQAMARRSTNPTAPDYERIARRIGIKLRDVYGAPEGTPLPAEHVDLLLRLRHKERDVSRLRGA